MLRNFRKNWTILNWKFQIIDLQNDVDLVHDEKCWKLRAISRFDRRRYGWKQTFESSESRLEAMGAWVARGERRRCGWAQLRGVAVGVKGNPPLCWSNLDFWKYLKMIR